VARVLADDAHRTVAADHLALLTHLLDAGTYFHFDSFATMGTSRGRRTTKLSPAAVTRDAVEELGLAPGVPATAAVKATSVMVERGA